jgi:GGDEF domain-containing protein
VVLLQHVDAAGAKATLERFRAKIAAENFPQVGKVTVSIGFAPARAADTPSALLGSADEALYFAKSNGRNQVCSYDELVASGLLKKKEMHTEAEFF